MASDSPRPARKRGASSSDGRTHYTPRTALAFNKANAAFRDGHWSDALELSEAALREDATLIQAVVLKARCLTHLDRLGEAADTYGGALRIDSGQFSAWLEFGNVCRRLGRQTRALESYQKAVSLRPDDQRGHLAFARALEERQDPTSADKAAYHYHRALVLSADETDDADLAKAGTLQTIGRFRLDAGNAPGALEALRQSLLCSRLARHGISKDAQAEIRIDLADCLLRLGLKEDAHAELGQASQAENEATLQRLADLAYRFNLWEEAVAVLRRIVGLHPDSATAHLNLADMLARSWQLDAALEVLDQANLQDSIHRIAAVRTRATIASRMGDADRAMSLYKGLIEDGHKEFSSSLAMTALYSDGLTPKDVHTLNRNLFAPLAVGARSRRQFGNDLSLERPLKIGMVTGDLHHQHPVNLFLQPMLAHWDNQDFPLTLYFTGKTHDEQTNLAKQRAGVWRETLAEQIPQAVEADRIDILIDLAGHTSSKNMRLFAQRLAPVQATFLGYPGSTGVPNIDWLVGDPVVTPPDHDHLYSENVARLPGPVFCYAPEKDYPAPLFGTDCLSRPLTFGSFNNVPKLTPRTIGLCADVLKAVPDSRLLLKAPSFRDDGAIARFKGLFAERGIDPSRLFFRGPTSLDDMMGEYGEVDIGLDPLPYNGGTTTLQALWMGVPVITLKGEHFVSRMGASFLSAAGLPSLIAPDDRTYVDIAVHLAQDRQGLLDLKRSLRGRLLDSPGWSIEAYVKAFEQQLSMMWADFVTRAETGV